MLALFETPAGYALFKVKDKILSSLEDSLSALDTTSLIERISLKDFCRFKSAAEALASTTDLCEGKLSTTLNSFIQESIASKSKYAEQVLAISDPKLAGSIAKAFNLKVRADGEACEVMRLIREHMQELLQDICSQGDMNVMTLGLAHSLSRHRIRFTADKVDTMIVQAIGLLDDLDKELNIYGMRLKEWYGWHFPELVHLVSDNVTYARVVRLVGFRSNAPNTDLKLVLAEDSDDSALAQAEDLAAQLVHAADMSMGTEISQHDLDNIQALADQVINIGSYRAELYEYLKNRMSLIAPNLTALIGELVGARLIAHAGSLLSLAKHPASTVQILGAEKALFRALKTKSPTPKYGLIFHASLVGQASTKTKGKISRVLAAKCALAARVDAFRKQDEGQEGEGQVIDEGDDSMGQLARVKVEQRLSSLEHRDKSVFKGIARVKPASANQARYDFSGKKTEVFYNKDLIMSNKKVEKEEAELEEPEESQSEHVTEQEQIKESSKKKDKKKKKRHHEEEDYSDEEKDKIEHKKKKSKGHEKEKKHKKKSSKRHASSSDSDTAKSSD